MTKLWTEERVDRAIEILRATPRNNLDRALRQMSAEFRTDITLGAVDRAMIRRNTTRQREHARDFEAVEQARREAALADASPTEPYLQAAEEHELPDDSWTTSSESPPPRDEDADEDGEEEDEDETESELAFMRMKRENAELIAARKRLLADLEDAREQIERLRELRAAKPLGPIDAVKKVGGKQRQGVPVMLCSDWHVEEPVEPNKIGGLNKYNLEIADECITQMADAFEWLLRDPRFDCRAAVIWLGGDLYSGHIHEELVETSALSPTQAVLWLQERVERMLRTIAATCPNLERIRVPCNDGNHGRLTHKIRISTRTANSLEWLMYQNLAARMSDDPRFEFDIAEGEWSYVDVFNKRLAFTHGDSFQGGGGVGGISVPIRRGIARQFQHRKVDYFNLGHFHQRNDFGEITVNGSMIGYGDFAQRHHFAPEPRMQTWFMMDSEIGKSFSAPVSLPQYAG